MLLLDPWNFEAELRRREEEEEWRREVADAGGAVLYLIGQIELEGWDVKAFYTQMAQDYYLDCLWRNLKEYERNAIYVHFLTSKQQLS